MSFDITKLFSLLPAVYRERDTSIAQSMDLLTTAELAEVAFLEGLSDPTPAQQAQLVELLAKQLRGPLQSLMMIVGEQAAAVEDNMEQLYDDIFIETCAPWAIPYIGDLIGYKPIVGAAPGTGNPRADVANTIGLRRRKGTATALEQLARNVTGWSARAVEFFQLLGTTQYMKHLRSGNVYAPDLRDWRALVYEGTAFDSIPRTVDVRRIASERGRYNLPNIGIFLWSLTPYSATQVEPIVDPLNANRFWMSPLSNNIPLFTNPASEETVTQIAQPQDTASPLKRSILAADMQLGIESLYYGTAKSIALYRTVSGNSALVDPSTIIVGSLADSSEAWVSPSTSEYGLDPELGRLTIPSSEMGTGVSFQITYYYGFMGDVGGGEYPRSQNFPTNFLIQVEVNQQGTGEYNNIKDAIDYVSSTLGSSPTPGTGIVEISDNAYYNWDTSTPFTVPNNCTIQVRGADGVRPTAIVSSPINIQGGQESAFELNGLLITRAKPGSTPSALDCLLEVTAGGGTFQLAALNLQDVTLVPGWSLDANNNPQVPLQPTLTAQVPGLQVNINRSVLGGLLVDTDTVVNITDSIVDATSISGVAYGSTLFAGSPSIPGPGGQLNASGCTFIGKMHTQTMNIVSDSILLGETATNDGWNGAVLADQKQVGGVRFSFLPVSAQTPTRYECSTPDDGLTPDFTSLHYGAPGYCQLRSTTNDAIRRGADDRGEMGAFHFVQAPQRESDLIVRLTEFLPVGMEAGIFYET